MRSSDGIGRARVMIAPDPGLARMPLSHPEQGCGARRLPVLLLANLETYLETRRP